jgi:lysophospholipase L1-like esterase
VSRASRARKIAVAAVYGGGGIGLIGAGAAGLITTQATLARRSIGQPTGRPPVGDGLYGPVLNAPTWGMAPLRLALLGDSSAAGLGVHDAHQTPGALIAAGLAEASHRLVQLHCVAVVGAESRHLEHQVDSVLAREPGPDVAVIMVGANDVTHQVKPQAAVRLLDQAVRRLHAAGVEVVVGTCPDLGTLEPVSQPLRWLARRWSRQLAAAQTIAVVEAGGRTVSLGDILGPEFAARPRDLFGPDRFHPSVEGYASAATALLPSVCAALGHWYDGEREEQPDVRRGEGIRPVAVAAVEAVDAAGTEVAAAQVGGSDRGPRGRWALLRHRRRAAVPEVTETAPDAAGLGLQEGEFATLAIPRPTIGGSGDTPGRDDLDDLDPVGTG